MECDPNGRLYLKEDQYGRKLTNLWLQERDEVIMQSKLSLKLAGNIYKLKIATN